MKDDGPSNACGYGALIALAVAIGLIFTAVEISNRETNENELREEGRAAAILSSKDGRLAAETYRAGIKKHYAGRWIVKEKIQDQIGDEFLLEPPSGPDQREYLHLGLPAVVGDKIVFSVDGPLEDFVPNRYGHLPDASMRITPHFASSSKVAVANGGEK
jgi:hypothetical protein